MNISQSLQKLPKNDIKHMKKLLDTGVSVNLRDSDGYSPLHWADQEGYFKMARLLVQRGAILDVVDKEGLSPLEVASTKGNANIVKLLLKGRQNPCC